MKKRILRFLTLCLAFALLTGCTKPKSDLREAMENFTVPEKETLPQSSFLEEVQQKLQNLPSLPEEALTFADMVYLQPDMQAFSQFAEECCQEAETAQDVDTAMQAYYDFYDAYDRFYTDYLLADIHYSCDLTDTYWEEQYNFCLENTAVVDKAEQDLYYALAASSVVGQLEGPKYFGRGYFDAYKGESTWDEAYMELLEQENALLSRYYQMEAQALETEYYSDAYFTQYGEPLAQLFVEMVALRQQIAQKAGYDSYAQYVYEGGHYRDYTPEQAEEYLQNISRELRSIYEQVNGSYLWQWSCEYCTEQETFDYVKTAAQNMGGKTAEAFSFLEERQLYHISYGKNKMEGAFETFFPSYAVPFVYMAPYEDQTDRLSFAHEFGHFANDYVCEGSYAGTDVAEVHSQAMEYLSLLYGQADAELEAYKLADCLCTYVEQAAYALFEQQVYALEGDDLTVENVCALYEKIGTDFGFNSWNWDSRDFVSVGHFYTNPMYIVSYVVSNDVAFQIYQMEKEEAGAGLAVFEDCLKSSDSYLVSFAQDYGLASPFEEGRLEAVRATMETELAPYV